MIQPCSTFIPMPDAIYIKYNFLFIHKNDKKYAINLDNIRKVTDAGKGQVQVKYMDGLTETLTISYAVWVMTFNAAYNY